MATEKWKIVSEHPDYLISNHGRIISNRGCNVDRLLNPQISNRGYYFIGLRNDKGKQCWYNVHKLVASHFLKSPENPNFKITFKDGDCLNVKATNLKYDSHYDIMKKHYDQVKKAKNKEKFTR